MKINLKGLFNRKEKKNSRLYAKSFEIRKAMLEMCINAGKGHVTSCLSCVDILVALYYADLMRFDAKCPDSFNRDRLVLSKGQASPALYTILADLGFFDKADLKGFTKLDGKLAVHLQKSVPGVELTVGSLGQGYGVAAGMALSAKMNRELHNVFAILGDGECYEGSIWETAMFASHNNLNNLITIVDRNFLCVTDFTEDLVALEPMEDKWKSFGFGVIRINGHCFEEILAAIEPLRSHSSAKPTVIIADTVKGKGVKSLCYDPLWHGCAPGNKVATQCIADLKRRYEDGQ
ncbi:MAG: transketolase [Candidatus Omnitrophica bacterium]|nr:transketolase [Candidatus Omnitrophota bacterium]